MNGVRVSLDMFLLLLLLLLSMMMDYDDAKQRRLQLKAPPITRWKSALLMQLVTWGQREEDAANEHAMRNRVRRCR